MGVCCRPLARWRPTRHHQGHESGFHAVRALAWPVQCLRYMDAAEDSLGRRGAQLAPADGASTCASCLVRLVVSVVQGGNGVAGIEALGSSAPSYPLLRTVMRLSTE